MGRAVDAPAPSGKPLASLTPRLLARKGGARPAMRSPLALVTDQSPDDLGWNDMGEDDFVPAPRVVTFLREAAPVRPRRPRGAALRDGGKAAFTLRLDAERHLKLRLACTLDACSAQALVTDALDRLLAEMPEIEALSGNISSRAAKRRQS